MKSDNEKEVLKYIQPSETIIPKEIEAEAFALYPDYEELQDGDYEHYAMINKGRIKLRDAYVKGAMRHDNEFLRRACANATADLIIERHANSKLKEDVQDKTTDLAVLHDAAKQVVDEFRSLKEYDGGIDKAIDKLEKLL